MKKRNHIFISGSVQGVFFRLDIKKKADELNLAGFVRNLQDGRVEAVFEGEQEKLDSMLNFCESGNKFVKIRNVEVREETYSGDFRDFKILKL